MCDEDTGTDIKISSQHAAKFNCHVFNSDQCEASHCPVGADRFRMQRLMQTRADEISITTISQRAT